MNGEVGRPRTRGLAKAGAEDDDDDYDNVLSLARWRQSSAEGAGRPSIASHDLSRLRKKQDRTLNAGGGEQIATAEKPTPSCARRPRGCQKPVAEQQPHREPRRADLRQQQTLIGMEGHSSAGRNMVCRVPTSERIHGNELDQTCSTGCEVRQNGWANFVKNEPRAQ